MGLRSPFEPRPQNLGRRSLVRDSNHTFFFHGSGSTGVPGLDSDEVFFLFG